MSLGQLKQVERTEQTRCQHVTPITHGCNVFEGVELKKTESQRVTQSNEERGNIEPPPQWLTFQQTHSLSRYDPLLAICATGTRSAPNSPGQACKRQTARAVKQSQTKEPGRQKHASATYSFALRTLRRFFRWPHQGHSVAAHMTPK